MSKEIDYTKTLENYEEANRVRQDELQQWLLECPCVIQEFKLYKGLQEIVITLDVARKR